MFSVKNSHISVPSWPILTIFVANIVKSCMLMDAMTTRKVHGWLLGVKTLKNHGKPLGENYSAMFNVKNSHISGPSWPILMIFVANMVNSCMLMDLMTTRKVHEWILGVKILKNHWKPLGENYSTMTDVKNSHISGPSWPILMIFVANMVNSCMLMDIMTTRSAYGTILDRKSCLEEV